MTNWDDADQVNDELLGRMERPDGCTCDLEYTTDYKGRILHIYWSLELTCHHHYPRTAAQLERLNSCPKQEGEA
ncbi:hypothetical protein FDF08_09695 [Micrococcus luteus]|nr:hypothetical protein FDF08_09695 [Micrococcus luteus]